MQVSPTFFLVPLIVSGHITPHCAKYVEKMFYKELGGLPVGSTTEIAANIEEFIQKYNEATEEERDEYINRVEKPISIDLDALKEGTDDEKSVDKDEENPEK